MISLCMIVKNEEENLINCLSSASPFVDEIIIVDTGSSDNTKSIASEYSDKVYDYNWCGDFAAARNLSVSKAANDWILVLDADEYISKFSKEKINAFICNKNNERAVGKIQLINILDDNNAEKRYSDKIGRLFNKKYFQYEGKIHEQIVCKDSAVYTNIPVDITVYHTGYTKEAINRTNKLKRNKDMLVQAITDNPDDPYLYYQLGKTYYMMKDYASSCCYFEKAMSFKIDCRLEYIEDMIETYGYSLINDNRYSNALKIEKYSEFYAESADFHFLMGLIYMNNAEFEKAVNSFLQCTRLSYGRMEGITTFLPYYNIGVIYEVLGFKDKAAEYYRLCGGYMPAMERLMHI